jgi:homoserine O-succinyltransferase
MPVYLDTKYPTHDRQAGSKRLCEEPQAPFQERSSRCLTIGLINNMPDGALEATERQFISLLDSASDGIQIRLLLYALPGVPRSWPNTVSETSIRVLNFCGTGILMGSS